VTSTAELSDPVRRIRLLQKLTIAWMIAEAVLSLWAAFRAKSPALLAFGGDSAIELFSAVVVLWRFQERNGKESGEAAEKRAARIAGILLMALALYVIAVACATLFGLTESSPSYLGIGVLIAATAVMPWLAWQKRRLATITESAALRADAAESMLCAYLSLVALLGLSARAWLHVSWADPIAALAATPFLLWEALRAW
jgi:divalent metal cation (Fe/Co/Zn/Cd) transporter